MSLMKPSVFFLCLLGTASSCTATFDLAYALSDKKKHVAKKERSPTEQVVSVNELQ